MNSSNSKYFRTAEKMDEALIECLEKKDFDYITVKEICEKAGVNRSTFYLHYETVADLLNECVEYTNKKCFEKYSRDLADVKTRLSSARPEDSVFISPEYLRPYLEFIRQNRKLYKVVLSHSEMFRTQSTFTEIFNSVFSPAMDKFSVSEGDKRYIALFYLGGITSVVTEWLRNDCSDPEERIVEVCMKCAVGWQRAELR